MARPLRLNEQIDKGTDGKKKLEQFLFHGLLVIKKYLVDLFILFFSVKTKEFN